MAQAVAEAPPASVPRCGRRSALGRAHRHVVTGKIGIVVAGGTRSALVELVVRCSPIGGGHLATQKGAMAMVTKAVGVVVIGAVAGALGCGTVPPPNDAWAAAQADVGRAQAGGAPDVPEAKLHLQLAEEDLQRSKRLMGDNNDRAASLTAVASAEAQLALS